MSSCCLLATIVSNEQFAVELFEVKMMLTLCVINHFFLADVKILFDFGFGLITMHHRVDLSEFFHLKFIELLGGKDLRSF